MSSSATAKTTKKVKVKVKAKEDAGEAWSEDAAGREGGLPGRRKEVREKEEEEVDFIIIFK